LPLEYPPLAQLPPPPQLLLPPLHLMSAV
jgi:hypothetical protein